MRVIVCGGRSFLNDELVCTTLFNLDVTAVAEGGATGADLCARRWARAVGVPVTTYAAAWNTFGKGAGPIRNQTMLREFAPDAVVAFPGGRGTADMVRRAKAAGVRVIEVTA